MVWALLFGFEPWMSFPLDNFEIREVNNFALGVLVEIEISELVVFTMMDPSSIKKWFVPLLDQFPFRSICLTVCCATVSAFFFEKEKDSKRGTGEGAGIPSTECSWTGTAAAAVDVEKDMKILFTMRGQDQPGSKATWIMTFLSE